MQFIDKVIEIVFLVCAFGLGYCVGVIRENVKIRETLRKNKK